MWIFKKNGIGKYFCAVWLCLFSPFGVCGNNEITARIIGGEDAKLGDIPFIVPIIRTGGDPFFHQFCAGSLISDRVVLTAAHCLFDENDNGLSASDIEVYVGVNDLSIADEEGERVQISSIVVHPDYDSLTLDSDIALLELSRSVSASSIDVADFRDFIGLDSGDLLTVAGWGALNGSSTSFPYVLQRAEVPLTSSFDCLTSPAASAGITSNMFCAGYEEGGVDSCVGDSGGPLYTQIDNTLRIVGIVSWGVGSCGDPGNYGVYTKVDEFYDWIEVESVSLQDNAAQIDFEESFLAPFTSFDDSWMVTSENSLHGNYSAQLVSNEPGYVSFSMTAESSSGTMSFWVYVDNTWDDFELLVDGIVVADLVDFFYRDEWRRYTVEIDAGVHTFQWRYENGPIFDDNVREIFVDTIYIPGLVFPSDIDGDGVSNEDDVAPYDRSYSLFADVSATHFARNHIAAIFREGITSGCNVQRTKYCPSDNVTRGQMAVFIMRLLEGARYQPPTATGELFSDVSRTHKQARYIEAFANLGITSGCGNGKFCPDSPVTRGQMSVFILRALGIQPAPATGVRFNDVPISHKFSRWIERLAEEGITTGCSTGNNNFCPDSPVTRAQMAVFMVRAFPEAVSLQ